jgi:uncharacterized RDD family membrane protein YckC
MALAAAPNQATARARAQATARRVHGSEADAARDLPFAGLVTRLIAFALDAALINAVAILVAAAAALVVSILPSGNVDDELAVVLGGAAFVLWVVGYFVAFWTTTGQTPGDRMLRIAVRRLDGSALRPRHAIVRVFGVCVSLPFLIGFWPILVTERRRGLHDWLAGTVVIAQASDGGRDVDSLATRG